MHMLTLKEKRKEENISQQDFKQMAGIQQRNLSDLENGRVLPQIRVMRRIESVLGRIDWINSCGMPNIDGRRKKTDSAKVQHELMRVLENLHTLPRQDRFQIIISLSQWIIKYLNSEAELEKMVEVHGELFRQRFVDVTHKN